MRIGRVEFGISRDANGKVAPFELHYNRGCCDCIILTLGWFYLTWLSGECLYDWENSVIGNEIPDTYFDEEQFIFEDIPKSTLEDWNWDDELNPGYSWGYDDEQQDQIKTEKINE